MAEGKGFEPLVGSRPQRFSRPPHSTALPSLRKTAQKALSFSNVIYPGARCQPDRLPAARTGPAGAPDAFHAERRLRNRSGTASCSFYRRRWLFFRAAPDLIHIDDPQLALGFANEPAEGLPPVLTVNETGQEFGDMDHVVLALHVEEAAGHANLAGGASDKDNILVVVAHGPGQVFLLAASQET